MQQPQFKIQGEGKKKKKKKKRKANYNVILYLLFPIYVTYKLQKYAPLVLYGFLNIIPKDPVFWVLDKKHHPKTFCQMLFNFFSFFFFNFFDLNTALFLSEFNKHLSYLLIIANSQNRDLSTITVVNVITLNIPTNDEADFIRTLLYTSTTTFYHRPLQLWLWSKSPYNQKQGKHIEQVLELTKRKRSETDMWLLIPSLTVFSGILHSFHDFNIYIYILFIYIFS